MENTGCHSGNIDADILILPMQMLDNMEKENPFTTIYADILTFPMFANLCQLMPIFCAPFLLRWAPLKLFQGGGAFLKDKFQY